jgi:hypothetical protein
MNVKETILVIFAAVITFLNSCESIPTDRYGFDLPVEPRSGGINTVEVDFTVSVIRLTGNIVASDGALYAEVLSPSGAVVFSTVVEAPDEVKIDKYLQVEEGEWRMRYFSLNGTGYMLLHLHIVR